jgi:hypothetical protein
MRGIWEIVAGISGILAVAVAVFVFMQGRSEQSKKVEIQLIASSTLVDAAVSGAARGIEILYAGHKIPNYALLQLRVVNVGGQPIRSADYETPIEIGIQNVSEILSAEQTSADPPGMNATPFVSGKTIQMPPVLLNPGDSITLTVGVVPMPGVTPGIAPLGRIAGVKRIDFRSSIVPEKAGRTPKDRIFEIISLSQAVFLLALSVFQLYGIARRRRLGA